MRNNRVSMREGVSNQVVVRHLKKSIDRRRLVMLPRRPGANGSQRRKQICIRLQKEVSASLVGPISKLIAASQNLIRNSLYAEYILVGILCDKPLPKRGTKIEPIVEVLGLDEDVGVEQVRHYAITPKL